MGAVVLSLATWVSLWMIQGIGIYCALAGPCPDSDVRVFPAVLFGGLMLVPLSVIVLTAVGERPGAGRAALLWVSFAALVLLAATGIALSLFTGGFAVPSAVFGVGNAVGVLVLLGSVAWLVSWRYRSRRVSRSTR